MSEGLRLGLVGTGAIAQSYFKATEGCSEVRWTGIADVRAEAAQAAAETLGCAAYRSHAELIEKGGCDAIIVCTPPATHAAIALDVIDAGIHIMCEKPLAPDVAQAQRICEAARGKGVVMAMASKFRYVDDVIRAKSLIASGVLGEILLMENAFTSSVKMGQRWNADPKVSGGGVLIDNGTHSVDIVRYLLGPIDQVLAIEGKRTQSEAVEDTATLNLRTASGINASVDLSWTINKELDTYIKVFGTTGTIFVGWRESKFRQASSPEWTVFGSGYDKVQAFRRQVLNFCNRIIGLETLLISAEDAVASVEVIRAAYESLDQGRWVKVAAPPPAHLVVV
jgi:predicted dehydrogenase